MGKVKLWATIAGRNAVLTRRHRTSAYCCLQSPHIPRFRRKPWSRNRIQTVTSEPPHGTFGSLTFRGIGDNLATVIRFLASLFCGWERISVIWGVAHMKVIHVCFAALGFAVARWFFKREPMPVTADPVARFRTSGLL